MVRLLTICCLLLFWQNTQGQGPTEYPWAIPAGADSVRGTLMVPPGSGPFPIVIIHSGSGPTDRNGNGPGMVNNSLQKLASELATHNIATLRYDKRGIAASTPAAPREADLSWNALPRDLFSWLTMVKTDQRFDRHFVLGHSMGALVGSVVADTTELDGFISLAGAGRPLGDLLHDQLHAQSELLGKASDPILEELSEGRTVDSAHMMLYSLFRPSIQPYLIEFMAYDPVVHYRGIDCPVLIINGTEDIQVSVDDAKALHKANPTSELELIEGMNHVLRTVPPDDRDANIAVYSNAEPPLSEGLTAVIARFINQK